MTKVYGADVHALHRVSFAVERGEWIAAMGPSGSGKSTLLNLLGGLDSPTQGSVKVEGQDLSGLGARELARYRAEKVGFVFQQYHLVPYLTALENVMLAQYFHSMAEESEARQALARVGLAGRLHHLPSQLSGGEQQRVCVARALINQPNMILADEPTGNLDEVNEAIVMSLMMDLHREGHTIVMVTHDPAIGRMAERRIELHHGRLSELSHLADHEEEIIDNLLKEVWKAREEGSRSPMRAEQMAAFYENRAMFMLMASEELISLEDGLLSLTGRGDQRAHAAVRRHRLAERLFFDTFGLDEEQLHANAHKIEHSLSLEVTEKICIFLNHPKTCPHGSPIPPGACCRRP